MNKEQEALRGTLIVKRFIMLSEWFRPGGYAGDSAAATLQIDVRDGGGIEARKLRFMPLTAQTRHCGVRNPYAAASSD